MSNQADEQEWWQDADGSFMHPREGQLTVEYLNDLHTAARVGRDALSEIANSPHGERHCVLAAIARAALDAMNLGGKE